MKMHGRVYEYPHLLRRKRDRIVSDAAVLRLADKISRAIAGELLRGELSQHQRPHHGRDWTAVGVLVRVPPTQAHPMPCAVQVLFDPVPADAELVALDRQLDVFFPLPHHSPPPPRSAGFPFDETYSVIWRRGKRVLQ